jgi:hypothetical protein
MAENEALGATRRQLLRAGVVETLQQITNTIAAMDEGAFEDIESAFAPASARSPTASSAISRSSGH